MPINASLAARHLGKPVDRNMSIGKKQHANQLQSRGFDLNCSFNGLTGTLVAFEPKPIGGGVSYLITMKRLTRIAALDVPHPFPSRQSFQSDKAVLW